MDGEGLDLGAMMSRIMENPEFANLVESLRTGTGNTGATDVKATSGEEAADEPKGQQTTPAVKPMTFGVTT